MTANDRSGVADRPTWAPIGDYALIGDMQTAGLVSKTGSIDWLCLPRFDSGACFTALLGGPEHGRWQLAPVSPVQSVHRRYVGDSLVLETEFTTAEGTVRVVDCMPIRDRQPDVVRRVEGVSGDVRVRCEVTPRFDYGYVIPWIRRSGRRVRAIAGPDTLTLDADVDLDIDERARITAEFTVRGGDAVGFRLAWTGLTQDAPERLESGRAIERTTNWWHEWSSRCEYDGPYRAAVVRSLITLKALTYAPTGGILAAPTTSLPEQVGGVRNWDYRYCWVRDATMTLFAFLGAGYIEEAEAWRKWLLRALAGQPEQMQIMYGIDGQRRLPEMVLEWLPGYANSRPVRIGNGAATQFQLDVYGELMDALHQARGQGLPPDETAWDVQLALMEFVEANWREPDNGIWEMRGPRRHFTFSKVMAWVAADRAVRAIERFDLPGDAARWKRLREAIHADVCEHGFSAQKGAFTQYYGGATMDASLLLMAPVGFLPATDERIVSTVAAIERELSTDGFVHRYTMAAETEQIDDLPPGEGAFLPCTFWLADNYILQGREEEGRKLFERMLDLRNDVGLLSEEYDVRQRRLVGNFPQALSHIPLVNTAISLHTARGPAQRRAAD